MKPILLVKSLYDSEDAVMVTIDNEDNCSICGSGDKNFHLDSDTTNDGNYTSICFDCIRQLYDLIPSKPRRTPKKPTKK